MLLILKALSTPHHVRLSGELCARAVTEQLASLQEISPSCAYVIVECEPGVNLRPTGVGPLYATLLDVIRHGKPLLFVRTPRDTERTIRGLLSRLGTSSQIIFASNETEADAVRQRLFLRVQLGLRIPLRTPSSPFATSNRLMNPVAAAA